MVVVEARAPDGSLIEIVEVSLMLSILNDSHRIVITDDNGNQVYISRYAWPDIVKVVEEQLNKPEIGRH
jgi:hypothetical protein